MDNETHGLKEDSIEGILVIRRTRLDGIHGSHNAGQYLIQL
jgi:hypothetical protein